MNKKQKKKQNDSKSLSATVSKEIMPELLQLLARIMVRNEPNPLIRQAGLLEFTKAAKDIKQSPAKHLALAVYAIDKQGTTFEAGLLMGTSMAFCSLVPSAQENLRKMLADITAQQTRDAERATQAPQTPESGAV